MADMKTDRWNLRLEFKFVVAAMWQLAELLDIVVLDIVLLRRKNIYLPNFDIPLISRLEGTGTFMDTTSSYIFVVEDPVPAN